MMLNMVITQLLIGGMLTGLTVVVQPRTRQQVGVTPQSQPPIYEQGQCGTRYAIEFKDVDDSARVTLEDAVLFESFWGKSGIKPGTLHHIGHKPGNSGGLVDVTSHLKIGFNRLVVELYNKGACCSTALNVEVWRDDTSIYAKPHRERDSKPGLKFRQEFLIDVLPCSGTSPKPGQS